MYQNSGNQNSIKISRYLLINFQETHARQDLAGESRLDKDTEMFID